MQYRIPILIPLCHAFRSSSVRIHAYWIRISHISQTHWIPYVSHSYSRPIPRIFHAYSTNVYIYISSCPAGSPRYAPGMNPKTTKTIKNWYHKCNENRKKLTPGGVPEVLGEGLGPF